MRTLAVAVVVLAAGACDCAASHERDEPDAGIDGAAPADAGVIVDAGADAGTDAATCREVTRIPLGGSRAYGIAYAAGRVAVTMSNRVAIVPVDSPEPMQVPLPPELADGDGVGALIVSGRDGFLLAHAASVVTMDLDGRFGDVTALAVDNELPRVIDLESRIEGDRFATLVWDAHSGGGEDLPPVGPTKLFLLDATGATTATITVNADERMLEPMAIGMQTDVWYYFEEGWDEVGERPSMDFRTYSLGGELVGSGFGPIGNEPPPDGDPLDRWSIERFATRWLDMAWVNRSRISGREPEEALHAALALPSAHSSHERARAAAIPSLSIDNFFNTIVVVWTTGDANVHLDGIGERAATGAFDLGPGVVRTVHLAATNGGRPDRDRTLDIAYEIVTPAGAVEAWLARIECP